MKIHIWDLLKMQNVSVAVDIKNSLKDKIKSKIEKNIYLFADKLKINPTRLYEYFIWKKSKIPLSILFKLSTKLNIPNERVEENIILYKQLHVPSSNSIKNPKFPIEINPYFTSLLANLFFDGSVPEDGKGTYYNQKDEKIMNDFIEKIKNIFGEVDYSLKLDHRKVLKCRMPRIIGEICRYVYNVKSFGTFNSQIPKKVFKLSKEHKISFILTGIIDEGSIAYDGSIIFSISNKEMINNFNELCKELELKTEGIKQKKNSEHYYIYVTSINKFYSILKGFNKKYPLVSLRHKEERLKKVLEIKKQKFDYTKKFADKRRNLILNELKKKECSINYLSSKYLIPPKTVRRYMYRWIKECRIDRKKIGNRYIYFVLG